MKVDENKTPVADQANPRVTALEADLGFHDAVRIARGCTDYGGGYRNDDDKMRIYQHGIQTVINALEAAERNGLDDYQIAVLHSIGNIQNIKGE